MTFLSKGEIVELFERFKAKNPEPKPELDYYSPFTLLVAVVLSAQTADKGVNKVTQVLFKKADTAQKMVLLSENEISLIIKPVGLANTKARNILNLSKKLLNDYDGVIPDCREELMKLPGVGRKTANVVLNVLYKKPTMPVDTHILRVSRIVGLAEGSKPEQIEEGLLKVIPIEYMLHAHHWLLLHGRYVCKAVKPLCQKCIISDLCKRNGL